MWKLEARRTPGMSVSQPVNAHQAIKLCLRELICMSHITKFEGMEMVEPETFCDLILQFMCTRTPMQIHVIHKSD